MCGRYTLYSEKKIKSKFNIKIIKNFNISPRQNVLIINENFSPIFSKWGISANWNGKKHTIINARHETVNSKKIFKDLRRCIFVADGYFEWIYRGNKKVPYYHFLKDEMLYFAGLYNQSECCIITQESNNYLSIIHNRQPYFLKEENIELWLKKGEDYIDFKDILHFYPVSNQVNRIWENNSNLIKGISQN